MSKESKIGIRVLSSPWISFLNFSMNVSIDQYRDYVFSEIIFDICGIVTA